MKNEEIVAAIDSQLSNQHGIAMLSDKNRPKYLGKLVRVEMKWSNALFTFSEERILIFTPLMLISILDEATEGSSFVSKEICSDLYIGDRSLREIVNEIGQ